MRVRKKAAAWEQVSHNDAALTDVGQLFISLPKSVPTGAQADTVHTHALLSPGRRNILARFFGISLKTKPRPEVTAAKCQATCTWG